MTRLQQGPQGVAWRAAHLGLVFSILLSSIFSLQVAAAQTCMPPPPGIVAWWSLDEASGTTAADRAGSLPGTYAGNPLPTAGEVRGALSFNRPSYLVVPDSNQWAFGAKDFTIELWANFNTPGGGSIGHPSHIFIGNDEGPGTRNKWFFALGGGFLNFHINGPATGSTFLPLVPFSPVVGQWYHLAVVRSASTYTIYVDGLARGSATNGIVIPNPNAPLTIGQAEFLGFVSGKLDEISIYDRGLTSNEIKALADAGSSGKCIDIKILPNHGGNGGAVSAHLFGSGFTSGMQVSLERANELPVVGTDVVVNVESGEILANLDLKTRSMGAWDVTVRDARGVMVQQLPSGFTVESGGEPQIEAAIIGLPVIRLGQPQIFWAHVLNTGTVDAIYPDSEVDISMHVWKGVDLVTLPAVHTAPARNIEQSLAAKLFGGATAVPARCIPIQNLLLEAERILMEKKIRRRWLIDQIPLLEQQIEDAVRSGDRDLEEALREELERVRGELEEINELIRRLQARIEVLRAKLQRCIEEENPPQTEPARIPIVPQILMPLPITVPESGCVIISVSVTVIPTPLHLLPLLRRSSVLTATTGTEEQLVNTNSEPTVAYAEREVCTVNSYDPNDKAGPTGVGASKFVSSLQPLMYTIQFENIATATAPVQELVISDQLDPTVFDPSTVEFGPMTFLGKVLVPPPGASSWATTVDLRPEQQLLVKVIASSNPNNGLLSWRMTGIDPATGAPPLDPRIGFLPPNVNAPEGEGAVTVSVSPRVTALTGTELTNDASIIFDSNAPIHTPTWLNTLDADKPYSRMVDLPATINTTTFKVSWRGDDVGLGAGVGNYTVYVSTNNGPFAPFLKNTGFTSGTFTGGVFGNTYAFASIARDRVGNVEDWSGSAQTVTTLVRLTGDIDGDGDVDREDLKLITGALNSQSARPTDPRDLDHDGKITALDARMLVVLCTRPRCATQ